MQEEQKVYLGVTASAHKMQSELNTKHAEHERTRNGGREEARAGYCGPGVTRDCERCRLLFVSTLTYSLSSRASSCSFRTAMNASPRVCNAAARRTAVLRDIAGSFSTRSHVSRSTESISSFAPCLRRRTRVRLNGSGRAMRMKDVP